MSALTGLYLLPYSMQVAIRVCRCATFLACPTSEIVAMLFLFLLVNENILIIVVFDGVAILALNQLPK